MRRYGRYDPLIDGPQMLLSVIELPDLELEAPAPELGFEDAEPFLEIGQPDPEVVKPELEAGLLDLADFPDVREQSWYLASEQRFIEPRPSKLHVWAAGRWELDAALHLEARGREERAWRDGQMSAVMWLRERHRDQQDIGSGTTLMAEQFQELLVYMQALRDWPQSEQFPVIEHRPVAPSWIADQA